MTSEERYPDPSSASDWLKVCFNQSVAGSVWNNCACFLDVISRGNQGWSREKANVFSGYEKTPPVYIMETLSDKTELKSISSDHCHDDQCTVS